MALAEVVSETPAEPADRDRPLAGSIRAWLADLFDALTRDSVRWVVPRGGELLPNHAGFDLDLLVDAAAVGGVFDKATALADSHGLVVVVRQKPNGGKIAVFWVHPASVERNWLLLDIQTKLSAPGTPELFAGVVSRRFIAFQGWNVAIPDEPSQAVIAEMHARRKRAMANASSPRDGLRLRLGRLLFFRVPFVHRHRPLAFALCGPDGVGKSTLIDRMLKILGGYPIDVHALHHTTHVKEKERMTALAGGAEADRSNLYRAVRALWRDLVPAALKDGILGLRAELIYVHRMNKVIGDDFYDGRLTLIDRYIYDRWLKMRWLDRASAHKLIARLTCRILRPPRLTFAVSDDPGCVFARKQELSVERIADYCKSLSDLCERLGAPRYDLRVAGRSPEAVAAEAVVAMLRSCGSDLFDLIGRYERRHG